MNESKRKLTKPELRDILSVIIPPSSLIPLEISKSQVKVVRRLLKKQLENVETYPSLIPKIKQEIERKYHQTRIQPGETPGIIAAQSAGEKATQATLNSFHLIGSGNSRNDTSRFSEIINTSKQPKNPMCRAYFSTGNTSVEELRKTIGRNVVELKFGKFFKSIKYCIPTKIEPWYASYEVLHGPINHDNYNCCIAVTINDQLCYNFRITIREITRILNDMGYTDMLFIYSPDCFKQIHVLVNTKDIDMNSADQTDLDIQVYLEDVVTVQIKDFLLCGIAGVMEVFYLKDPDDKNRTWMIDMQFSRCKPKESVKRYMSILAVPHIIQSKTVSNNIWDIFHVYGAEATRLYIIEQFTILMDGVNACHAVTIANKMLNKGSLSSITRYSLRHGTNDFLASMTFEETMYHALRAATLEQRDNIESVSSHIICGSLGRFGTGMCSLSVITEDVITEDVVTEDVNGGTVDNIDIYQPYPYQPALDNQPLDNTIYKRNKQLQKIHITPREQGEYKKHLYEKICAKWNNTCNKNDGHVVSVLENINVLCNQISVTTPGAFYTVEFEFLSILPSPGDVYEAVVSLVDDEYVIGQVTLFINVFVSMTGYNFDKNKFTKKGKDEIALNSKIRIRIAKDGMKYTAEQTFSCIGELV